MTKYKGVGLKSVKSYKGVTLIEVMIVIAIAAILLAVAAPSFQRMVVRSNIESLVDGFATAVITARTEAASRGREVRVCANDACTSNDWSGGWFVVDSNGTELAAFNNVDGYRASLKTEADVNATSITFNAQGYNQDQVRYIFSACSPSGGVDIVRGVTVEFSGRAYRTDAAGTSKEAFFDKGDGTFTEVTLGC